MATKTKSNRKIDSLFMNKEQAHTITKKRRSDLIHAEANPSTRYFLAVNLMQLRKKKGMTQGELAKKAKLSLRTVQGLEAISSASPTLDTVDAVALALHVKVAGLLKRWEETEIFI